MITRKLAASHFAVGLFLLAPAVAEAQQILLVSPAQPTAAAQLTVFLSVLGCAFHVNPSVQGNTIYIYFGEFVAAPSVSIWQVRDAQRARSAATRDAQRDRSATIIRDLTIAEDQFSLTSSRRNGLH